MSRRNDKTDPLVQKLDALESRSARRLSTEELDEFVEMYHRASSRLARARVQMPGHMVEEYLNDIVARSYRQFAPPVNHGLWAFGRFFGTTFPVAVRELKKEMVTAVLLFVVPLVTVFWASYVYPKTAFLLAPPNLLEEMANAYARGHVTGRAETQDAIMTGFYIRNNVTVAFQCFATGVFWGIGTLFALVFNGLVIGAVGGYVCAQGHAVSFLSFVAGHGALELTAIVLAGGAGLRMGLLLLNPGPYSRSDAFKVHGQQILTVVLGSAMMLFVAAFIEGFWSPSSVPPLVKFAVAAVLWTLVPVYLVLAGRRVAREHGQ